MNTLIFSLFVVPIVASFLLLVSPKILGRFITIATVSVLSIISFYIFLNFDQPFQLAVPSVINQLVVIADIALLIYFGYVAIKNRSAIVGIMTILQLAAVIYLLIIAPHAEAPQFFIDKLSLFMFLLINVISGVIAVFALKYIDEEDCSEYRKKFFLSVIMWFIGVMNMIVSADNLEYFFLLFELTTLASFLLIGFRKDDISVRNALTALWMNQIGGLAILGAMIYSVFTPEYQSLTFSEIIRNAPTVGLLLPVALLSLAALIKGAQMPFSGWLLGAMVAPTPVSALLHSSTMVKIAPYVILKLSPTIRDTSIGYVIIGLTAFVFLVAAISALSQDTFKRILAYSTISLLGLMCLMAAVGTETAIVSSLILILFHGISKCMLFLNAGVIEHVFHKKNTTEMDRLGDLGPFTALVVAIGFMSLLLPPFGAFIGKWFSIETLGYTLPSQKLISALVIAALAIGGAVMALLYFKVSGVLLTRSGENEIIRFEKTHALYKVPMYILLILIFGGVILFPFLLTHYFAPVATDVFKMPVMAQLVNGTVKLGQLTLPIIPLIIAFIMLPLTIIVAMLIHFKKVDRVKEYMCGEKIDYRFSSFYFSTQKAMPYFVIIGGIFFIALIITGGML